MVNAVMTTKQVIGMEHKALKIIFIQLFKSIFFLKIRLSVC